MTDTTIGRWRDMLKQHCIEKKTSRDPSTFSIFLRKGPGAELEFQSWVYEEVERRSGLVQGWDHTTEFEFRTSNALWEVSTEFNYSVFDAVDLLLPPEERTDNHYYTIEQIDNLPLQLKPYMQILDFASWGETIYVNYAQMRVDALQNSAKLDEITQLESKFPNMFRKDLEEKCIRMFEKEPKELRDEKREQSEQAMAILSSPEVRELTAQVQAFSERVPNEPLVNGRPQTQDPVYQQELQAWNTEVQTWIDGIQDPRLRGYIRFLPGLDVRLDNSLFHGIF